MNTATYRRSATPNPAWIEEQEARCREYAREHGLTVSRTFTDIGHTGRELERLLEAAANGEISTVVVSDLARFGRRPDESIRTLDQLEEAGVTVQIADRRVPQPSGLEQRLMLLAAAAEPEPRRGFRTRRH